MSETKNLRNITLKKQITKNDENENINKPQHDTKKNKNNKIYTTKKETAEINPNKTSSKVKRNDTNTNKISQNKDILKNSPHHKRNHSQLDLSSGFFDLQSSKNDNEFEQQIQSNQANLAPGVTIGRDGKTPVAPSFVKRKYKDMLSPYEMTEIDDYPDVYFVGNSVSKKIIKGSFDDEKTFHYKAKVGDHIAYRYEILSILGRGVFGTVFKCFDHKNKEKVAIKVLVNTYLMNQQGKVEIENLKLLSSNGLSPEINSKMQTRNSPIKQKPISKRSSSMEISQLNPDNSNAQSDQTEASKDNPNLKHVVKMIDNFYFRHHICIVTEMLGESLREFMIRRTKSRPSHSQENKNADPNVANQQKQKFQLDPLPAQMVKLIAYQIMNGLASIHKKKIIHCDLKPENILFTTPQENDSPKKNSGPSKESALINSRKDPNLFKISYQSPKKITSHFTISFSAIDNFTLISQIKIVDFGTSCRQGEFIYNYIQSRFYRAPEIVLGSTYGTAIDVWSAGCIIAELFVGRPLFPAENDQDLLIRMIETLGTPPQSVVQMKADFQSKALKKTKTPPMQNRFFGDDGRLLNVDKQPVPLKTRLTTFLQSSDTMMIDFLTKCLEWDKNKRPSAAKLLKHPWIAEFAKRKI